MKKPFTYLFVLLAAVYILLTAVSPVDPATIARRHITLHQARLVNLSVAIPVIIIWFLAFYGSQKFYDYCRTIKTAKEGPAFLKLAQGLRLIALYIPVRAILKPALSTVISHHPALVNPVTDLVIYIDVVMPLVAFILISQAARGLTQLIKVRASLRATYMLVVLGIAVSVTYCYATFDSSQNFSATNWLVTTPHSMSMFLRITTIAAPYLFMWFIGSLAAYEIYLYQKYVKGIIYRQLLAKLSLGLLLVVVASMALQYLTAMAIHLQTLHIGALLSIAYCLLLVIGWAFIMITYGVRSMRKLEEV